MSILLGTPLEKDKIIQWIKDTTTFLVMEQITPIQRDMLMRNIDKMASFEGSFDVQCEVAQGAQGNAMRLTITIAPGRGK